MNNIKDKIEEASVNHIIYNNSNYDPDKTYDFDILGKCLNNIFINMNKTYLTNFDKVILFEFYISYAILFTEKIFKEKQNISIN